MSRSYSTFAFVFLIMLLCFVSAPILATQSKPLDTLDQIERFRKDAIKAISSKNFDMAVINLNKANRLVANIKDTVAASKVLLTSIDLHYQIHNYEKASSESEKLISLLQEKSNYPDLARAYNLYASVLTQTGKFKKALVFFKKADEIFKQLNDNKDQSKVLLGLGILEQKRGNLENALNYFDTSIPLFKSFNLPYEQTVAQLNKAEVLLKLEEKTSSSKLISAKIALANAIKIIEANNYSNLKIESFKIISMIAFEDKDYKAGERNLNLYLSEKDSIQQVYISIISRGLDLELNLDAIEEIKTNLKKEIDKSTKSINFSKLTNSLSIALIIILSLLTLSLYKNNNLRAKANELLQDKNKELILAKEKVEKASLARTEFLSTVTHELRTPLYAVTGLTHLLLEENPKESQKENLNSLKFSGEHLLSLINNILDLNKLEANKVDIEKTTFNLKQRMKDVIITLKTPADDGQTKLHLEFDESIPNSLSGDPLKLSQVLINLIGNSIKFTTNGDLFVRVQKLHRTNDKISLHFEVEDNGIGISKMKQKSIFEPFSQGSLQINRKFGGTGLGLSIVKKLLELMNSEIQLESILGKGSKFWFNIDFQVSEETGDETSPKKIVYEIDYKALENKSVLVVEDNKINQLITKKILEKNMMKCLVADNGIDAIKMVKENTFDIVLMDIHMPGISGIEATKKIREFDGQLPIIALTAVTIDENLEGFYQAGFNEIIPKPFKPEDFFEKIYRTIGKKTETLSSN
jgi:signal transduction histidine kinase/ActR/RegA family two-component response regulator